MAPLEHLCSCHCCGLIQEAPPEPAAAGRLVCCRCRTTLHHGYGRRNAITAACCASALVLYLPAMLLPMLRVEQFGHVREDSLVTGVISLLHEGYWFVGAVVFLFSIVLPPVKLIALWVLSSNRMVSRHEHRAFVYKTVELVGKWGMLDVMLVAVLVAFVKLGDVVEIHAGSGVVLFSVMVFLSLLAGALFNPRAMWDETAAGTLDGEDRNGQRNRE